MGADEEISLSLLLLASSFPLLSSTHSVRVDLDGDAESSARGRNRHHGCRRNRQETDES